MIAVWEEKERGCCEQDKRKKMNSRCEENQVCPHSIVSYTYSNFIGVVLDQILVVLHCLHVYRYVFGLPYL